LIDDIQRNGILAGIGKPEILKYRSETEINLKYEQKKVDILGGQNHTAVLGVLFYRLLGRTRQNNR
jgi:hypothetical protein